MSFRAGREIRVGPAPTDVAVACLDDDALQDLVVIARSDDRLEVLLGSGTNNFIAGPEAPDTGREPAGVTALDFPRNGRGDGIADFVLIAEATDGAVSVYRNDGRANLTFVGAFSIDGEPSAIAVYPRGGTALQQPCPAVPNQIGTQVVVADRLNSRVLLLDIDESGNLSVAGEFPTGLEPVALTVGEVNIDVLNDGCCDNRNDTPCPPGLGCPCASEPQLCLDVVTANDVGRSVSILIADEHNGGFEPARDVSVEGFPGAVSLGNFDGDAGSDFAVTLPLQDRVAVYQQQFGGGFNRVFEASVPRPSSAVIVDDQAIRITGDGIPDLLVTSEAAATLAVFAGLRDATASPFNLRSLFTTGLGPMALVTAETDRDPEALADLIIPTRDANRIMALRGRGSGSFIAAVSIPTSPGPLAVEIADFTGDSRADVVTANEVAGSVTLFPGRGDGVLRPPVDTQVLPGPSLMQARDFSGDRRLDLVVASRLFGGAVLYGANSDGTFSQFGNLPTSGLPVGMQAGDLDADGVGDLVFAYKDLAFVDVFFDLASSEPGNAVLPAAGPASDAAIGDVNNDGLPDVVATIPSTQTVNVWFQLQGGGFRNPLSYPTGAMADRLVLADLNEDGQTDAVTANHDAGSLSVLIAQGGQFLPPRIQPLEDLPAEIRAEDLNQDNVPDLLVLSDSSGRLTVMPGDGLGNFPVGKVSSFAAGFEPRAFAVGQFTNDDDLQPDAIVADFAIDRITVFRNNTDVPQLPPSPRPTFTAVAPSAGGGGGCDLGGGSHAGVVLVALGLLGALLRRRPASRQ